MNNEFFENVVKIGVFLKWYSFMCSKNGVNSWCYFVVFVWCNKIWRIVEVEFDGFLINSFFIFIDFVFFWYFLKKFYLIVCLNKWNNWYFYMFFIFKLKWWGFKLVIIVFWFLVIKFVEIISNVIVEKMNKLFLFRYFKRMFFLI